MFVIKNPVNPSTTFTADITTRDIGGNLIDGPSQMNVYTIKKIVSGDLADGSVTSTKPAESFMKKVNVFDLSGGHAVGWNPNGATTTFTISEPAIQPGGESTPTFFIIEVASITNHFCDVINHNSASDTFVIDCSSAPAEGDVLNYVVGNLPEHNIF